MQLDTPRKTRRTPRSAHALDLLVKATGGHHGGPPSTPLVTRASLAYSLRETVGKVR